MNIDTAAPVTIPGFTDHHAHLLRTAAGVSFPATPAAVADFHRRTAAAGSTPMDVLDPPVRQAGLAARLRAALAAAAGCGLVEVTEMGIRSWACLDALAVAQQAGPLPARVRVYLASGLADEVSLDELDRKRADCGPWVRLEGVKFYADGWLGPRTCALCQDFADTGDAGLLFTDASRLARRIEPLAARGWRIATHAIGDRAAAAVLAGYERAFDGDLTEMAAAGPRIEHASVLSAELIARMAAGGVTACIQPSFAVTDAGLLGPALGADRAGRAYPYAEMAAAGVRLLAGSDYPIEVIEPLVGLARLVTGRSRRAGFETSDGAPPQAVLPAERALAMMTDPAAGQTMLSADPRAVPAAAIDEIEILGTGPAPFWPA
jgi:predicted amidohydrolase YtcJ